jgi:hypothetical protein
MMAAIEPSKRTGQAALKRKYLKRDGYHCTIFDKFDATSFQEKLYSGKEGESGGYTEYCHILPFALGNFNVENAMEVGNISFPFLSSPAPPKIKILTRI